MIAGDKAAGRCQKHTLMDSVGTCAVCGVAGCSTCLVQEAAGWRCRECIRKGRQIQPRPMPVPAQPDPAGMVPAPTAPSPPSEGLTPMPPQPPHVPSLGRYLPRDAKFFISLLVFLAGVMIPLLVTLPNGTPDLGDRMQVGYAFWAVFWGAPAAWRLGRKLVFWLAAAFGGCPGLGLGLALAWLGGWLYCLCGGGIYQFLKHWWSRTRPAAWQG